MDWSKLATSYVLQIKPVEITPLVAERIYQLVDLTSLNESDTEASIASLCQKAQGTFGHVAAVCVYPRFAKLVADQFANTSVKAATVANFPAGNASLDTVLAEISCALQAGVQEIDIVFPYERYLAGDKKYTQQFITSCKAACGKDVTLKVILETGCLRDISIIADASYDVLMAGADFIKTSTGKIETGATLQAVAIMLLVVQRAAQQIKRNVGVKVSGGVRHLQQAVQYVQLAELVFDRNWVKPDTFRIGASQLIDEVLKVSL